MRSKRRPPPISKTRGADHRINRRIRVPIVQVIDHEGTNHGEIETHKAQKIADDAGLDLVELSPNARPPVCKIMNYGQYKYTKKKRSRGQKAHQAKVKGVRLHPNTAEHDIDVAMKKCEKFMGKGDKVLIQVWFKGREMAHTERGTELLQRFAKDLEEIAKIESPIRREGKRMHLLLTPLTAEERNARAKRLEKQKEDELKRKAKELAKERGEIIEDEKPAEKPAEKANSTS
ncbi:translation initiation factor IF-3 [Planctomycetota bacterium]|nr:translation initiation factor IF-3 [Planctomycetota bacterium]